MSCKDFEVQKIYAGQWTPVRFGKAECGKTSLEHTLPVSRRARAWFQIGAYRSDDPKLFLAMRSAFGTAKLRLSTIQRDWLSNPIVGSRFLKEDYLVTTLNAFEISFMFGHQLGHFDGIMALNPRPEDFWTVLKYISEERDRIVQERYALLMTNAVNKTIHSICTTKSK